MPNLQELVNDRKIGILSAHPDDHLIHGNLINEAILAGAEIHEATITLGKRGKNFRTDHPRYVLDGNRVLENNAAAQRLGISTVRYFDGRDGRLKHQVNKYVTPIADWIEELEIDLLVTTGELSDHPDHASAARIGLRTLGKLVHERRRVPSHLGLTFDPQADGLQARATPQSIQATLEAAELQVSQFRIARSDEETTWQQVEGFALHPETLDGLGQYPIFTDAYYKLTDGITWSSRDVTGSGILEAVS